MHQLFPLEDSDESIEVCFLYVYDAEAMDLVVVHFFLDHNVYDGFPAVNGERMANCID
jgi:hypothetical protein